MSSLFWHHQSSIERREQNWEEKKNKKKTTLDWNLKQKNNKHIAKVVFEIESFLLSLLLWWWSRFFASVFVPLYYCVNIRSTRLFIDGARIKSIHFAVHAVWYRWCFSNWISCWCAATTAAAAVILSSQSIFRILGTTCSPTYEIILHFAHTNRERHTHTRDNDMQGCDWNYIRDATL